MTFYTHTTSRLAFAALCATCTSAALAAPVQTAATSTAAFTVPTAASNLLSTATVVSTGDFSDAEGLGTAGNVAVLADGAFGRAGLNEPPGTNPEVLIVRDNAVITYNFAVSIRITSIASYVGWRDGGRANQNYVMAFAQATAPTTFTNLATVAYADLGGSPTSTEVVITDTTGTLATNVSSVRFTFNNPENGYVGYRELAVQGVATVVPEAGSLALLAAATLLGGVVLRKKR